MKLVHDQNLLHLTHRLFEASWDLSRGGVMVYLHDLRSDVTLIDARVAGVGPDLLVAVSETLEDVARDVRLSTMGQATVEIRNGEGESRVILEARNDELGIERELRFRDDSAWIDEKVTLRNLSDRALLIDRYPDWAAAGKTAVAGDLYHWGVTPGGVDYVLEGLRIGGDFDNTFYVHPAAGYPFFHNVNKFADMGDTAFTIIAGHHGAIFPCVMAWNPQRQAGLLFSCMHDRCLRYIHVAGGVATKGGQLSLNVWWARWLAPGERHEVATWQLVPFVGDYGPMLAEYRQWLAEVHGVRGPQQVSPRLDEMFVGTFPVATTHALGSFEAMIPYIDIAADVGCTAMWWTQPWLDSFDVEPRAWMSRCQPQSRDFKYGITPEFGGEAGFLKVVDYIHDAGLLNIVWMTGYGLTSFDPLFQEHPEAFVRARRPIPRSAQAAMNDPLLPNFDPNVGIPDEYVYPPFGGTTVGVDTMHPLWRKFWLTNQEYWVSKGVDGIFFDSFNPMPPNYALRPWPGEISLEIINLQREARRRCQEINPSFFSFTEGGGYRMASVNDFTHCWHGATAPPLPPFRTHPLTPAEEARYHRDELLSSVVGGRSWANVAREDDRCRPRVLFNFFSGKMPVLNLFATSARPEPIRNELEYWAYFKPYPADAPAPAERAHWDEVRRLWQIRQSIPELKSGRVEFMTVTCDDPGVFAFVREVERQFTLVAINFHDQATRCAVAVDLHGVERPAASTFRPRDVLNGQQFPSVAADELRRGFRLDLPGRDGAVIRFES